MGLAAFRRWGECKAAQTHEDNFSPNMGFMANYPPGVVKLTNRFVWRLCGFAVFVLGARTPSVPSGHLPRPRANARNL
jgi:hypothetical protein